MLHVLVTHSESEHQLVEAGVAPERSKLMFNGLLDTDGADQDYLDSFCAAYNDLKHIIQSDLDQNVCKSHLDSIALAA